MTDKVALLAGELREFSYDLRWHYSKLLDAIPDVPYYIVETMGYVGEFAFIKPRVAKN